MIHHTRVSMEDKPITVVRAITKVVESKPISFSKIVRHDSQQNALGTSSREIRPPSCQAGKPGMDPTQRDFPHRIIFMSMFNDIELDRARNGRTCINITQEVADYPRISSHVVGFVGSGSKQSWGCGAVADTRGKWDAIAEKMTDIFG